MAVSKNVSLYPPKGSRKSSARSLFRVWSMWLVSSFFVLFQFFLQLTSGAMVQGVMKTAGLSAFGAAVVISSYYYVYVALQAPAGFLVDRFGVRRVLSLSAFIVSLGCLGFAFSHRVSLMIFFRMLTGGGAAFAFVGCLNLTRQWFPAKYFGVMAAAAEMMGMLGSIVGGLLFVHMIPIHGWQRCMSGAAGVVMCIAITIWFVVFDRRSSSEAVKAKSFSALIKAVKSLIKRPVVWGNGFYSGLMFGVVTVFVAMWGVPYLQSVYHLSLIRSTEVTDMAFLGVAVSCPLVGYLDAVTGLRRCILVGAPVLGMVAMLIILFVPLLSVSCLAVMMLVVGMAVGPYMLTFVIGSEIALPQTQATSVGIVNMVSVGTAPVLQPVIGCILGLGKRSGVMGSVHFSVIQYQHALILIPLMMGGAAIIAWFLPSRQRAE